MGLSPYGSYKSIGQALQEVNVVWMPLPFRPLNDVRMEREIKQKNVGRGKSTNNNCALNSIDSAAATVACPVRPPPEPCSTGFVDSRLVEYD
jgi:hypothetical protein